MEIEKQGKCLVKIGIIECYGTELQKLAFKSMLIREGYFLYKDEILAIRTEEKNQKR